jgi:hypothetical protein
MNKATQAETLAGFVAALPGGAQAPANRPAVVAAAGAGLPAAAVDWAVSLGHRCADAVLALMGEDAALLPEDETRRGIEFSVLSAVRRLTVDVRDFPLSQDQVSLAHKMARRGLPYERYMHGLRLVQEMLLEALLDEAVGYLPALARDGQDGRAWLPGALALGAGEFRAAVGVPAAGPAGFRRSYLAARDADHLGRLAAQDDETHLDLRATALCYLENGCSLVRTATALHVHRNTVLYRLGSIERLLGRELGANPLATHAALALVQRLGPALLDRDFAPRPQDGQELADATYL